MESWDRNNWCWCFKIITNKNEGFLKEIRFKKTEDLIKTENKITEKENIKRIRREVFVVNDKEDNQKISFYRIPPGTLFEIEFHNLKQIYNCSSLNCKHCLSLRVIEETNRKQEQIKRYIIYRFVSLLRVSFDQDQAEYLFVDDHSFCLNSLSPNNRKDCVNFHFEKDSFDKIRNDKTLLEMTKKVDFDVDDFLCINIKNSEERKKKTDKLFRSFLARYCSQIKSLKKINESKVENLLLFLEKNKENIEGVFLSENEKRFLKNAAFNELSTYDGYENTFSLSYLPINIILNVKIKFRHLGSLNDIHFKIFIDDNKQSLSGSFSCFSVLYDNEYGYICFNEMNKESIRIVDENDTHRFENLEEIRKRNYKREKNLITPDLFVFEGENSSLSKIENLEKMVINISISFFIILFLISVFFVAIIRKIENKKPNLNNEKKNDVLELIFKKEIKNNVKGRS